MNTKTAHVRNVKQALRQSVLVIGLLLVLFDLAASIAYANPPNAPPAQQPDYSGLCFIVILGWIALAIVGIAQIIQKGYLSGIGCGVWALAILFGWWTIPIILGLGPVWIGIAAMLETKRPCPLCKSGIPITATVCPNCHRDLPLNWSGALEPPSPSLSPSLPQSESQSDKPAIQPAETATSKTVEKKCTHCGLSNPADFKFCRECGTPLSALPEQTAG